jgi:hypothetical protein
MATTSLSLSGWQKRHNRLGNDDPDLVGIFGGWGTVDRGRALVGRTVPGFIGGLTSTIIIIC